MMATAVLAVALVGAVVFALGSSDQGQVSAPGTSSIPPTIPTTLPIADSSTSTQGAPVDEDSEELADGEILLAVVVDNAPQARPQVGLGEALVLIEYPVEGGLTRFAAVVDAASEGLIGPVRSLRPVNADLISSFSSAVVSSGGQPLVMQSVAASGLTSVTPFEIPSFVSLGRPAPHDMFLDLADLASYFNPQPTVPGIPIGGALSARRSSATEIGLPFAGVGYRYEGDSGYVRFKDGEMVSYLDGSDQQPSSVAHDTLIVMHVAERAAGYLDSNGIPVSDFDVIGSGVLSVFHGGEWVRGSWARSALVDPYQFFDESGESFGIPAGSVYLALIPREAEVTAR